MSARRLRRAGAGLSVLLALPLTPAPQVRADAAPFMVGAAVGDITPPCTGATGACPKPPAGFSDGADCAPPAGAVFPGPRLFAFEEPYVDLGGSGHYDYNDPWLDCPAPTGLPDARWDGNFLGGGSNAPRYYDHVADPVTARAMVVSNSTRTIAVEVLDHEGAFDTFLQRIRALVGQMLPSGASLKPDDIFISSTHNESAPDTIGLYGVDNPSGQTSVTSSSNPYWADYMVHRAAEAVVNAYKAMRPARIRYAEAIEPPNMRQCFSSYPFIDDQLMPTLQAVDAQSGATIVTLADVSQHTESLGFNGGSQKDIGGATLDQEKTWITADWPYWFRSKLESDAGGIGIEMAGSVGSNETPEVFARALSRAPQHFVNEDHPAGCRTLYDANGAKVPLGYYAETRQLGEQLAGAVLSALSSSAQFSQSNELAGKRADVCITVSNVLFGVGGAAGFFSERGGYVANCAVAVPPAPNGTAIATEVKSQVAAFRIGDGEFVSIPGEVFPFTYLRGFVGPQDMPYPDFGMPPWLLPHMHTPYRFIDGLAEDMVGYIFPQGNGVGVPGEYPTHNPTADTDRFGCGHSDDSESANSSAGDAIGTAAAQLLDQIGGGSPEDIAPGRYVFPDGTLSRDPLGGPEVKCNVDTTFVPKGPAVAVWVKTSSGSVVIRPAAWMSLGGRAQDAPDRNTRGYLDASGTRHWLDVFPDIPGAPASVVLPAEAPPATGGQLPNTSR